MPDEFASAETWLRKVSTPVDDAALERISDALLDAMMNAAGEEPHLAVKLAALMKAQALLLAVISFAPDCAEPVNELCESYGTALQFEVLAAHSALLRDARRARKVARDDR